MQIKTPNSQSLIGPKVTVLIGQLGFSCAELTGKGKPQSYWLQYNSKNSFIRAGTDVRNMEQADSSMQAFPESQFA